MKRLVLMRHAKSDWSSPAGGDIARPLNKRGRKSAEALGAWLKERDYRPDEVLCSTAVRTRETLERLDLDAPVRFEERLYHAEADTMLESLRAATGGTVLMIGHNPGIAYFAATLVQSAPDHPRFDDYPTCATLVADFDIVDWEKAEPGTGRALDFVVPRELV